MYREIEGSSWSCEVNSQWMTYGCGWQVAKMGKFVREKVDVSRAMRPQGESQPTLAGALSLDTQRDLQAPSHRCDEKYRVPSNHSTSVHHGHQLLFR